MHLLLPVLILLLMAAIAHHLWNNSPSLPHTAGSWGAPANSDPRVAAAAMLCCVASASGSPPAGAAEQIQSLLSGTLDMTPEDARNCFKGGKQLARRLKGNLNSKLHQLRGPIERRCSPQEKQDVVDMLHALAGKNVERVPSVREALGRISASLLHD